MSIVRFYQVVSDVDHEGETHHGFFLGAEDALKCAETIETFTGDLVVYRCTVESDASIREEVTRKKLHS